MRRPFQTLGMFGLCAVAASAGGAFAQTKSDFMEGYPFQYEGQIGGLDAWSLPEQEDLWLVLPDGQTVIAGFVFNNRGNDIGSALLGIEPMGAKESLDMIFAANDDAVEENSSSVADEDAQAAPATEDDPEDLIAKMIADLDASASPEEFQAVLGRYAILLQGEAPGSERVADTPAPSAQASAAIEDVSVVPAAAAKPENPEQFLSAIAEGSFWFSVGSDNADPVYMFYDPACPYCARAIRNLEPRIEAGEIQLRLIPVPVISQGSLGLVAGILTASDPEALVLENARQLAGQGKTSIEPADTAAVRPEFLQGIQGNMDLAGNFNLPGVPFFAWSAAKGPKFLSGVPAMNYDFEIRVP